MSANKKTILFAPMNGWGHINACLGIAQELLSRGHRVVWAIDRGFEGKLSCFGFEEVLVGKVDQGNDDKLYWQKFMEEKCKYLKEDYMTIFREFVEPSFNVMISDTMSLESQYKAVLDKVKPNVIVMDMYVASVALTLSGIPFVWLFSATPHFAFFAENKIPPPWAGESIKYLNIKTSLIQFLGIHLMFVLISFSWNFLRLKEKYNFVEAPRPYL